MAILFANSGDPDQTPHSVACDLGLHCLPITPLWVFQLQWVKQGLKQFSISLSLLFFTSQALAGGTLLSMEFLSFA